MNPSSAPESTSRWRECLALMQTQRVARHPFAVLALATVLAAGALDYWILPPVGQFAIASPIDRLTLAVFVATGLFMSVVAERHRRSRVKAAACDREAALRRSQEALRESEARLRTIGDRLPGGAIYKYGRRPDGSTFFGHLSAGIERSTGYPAGELLAHPGKAFENILPEDFAGMERATRESAEALSPFDHQFRRRIAATGEVRWFHSRSMPRRLDDGTVVWDGVEFDITAEKRAAEARQQSEALLHAITDYSEDMIFVKDRESRLVFLNPAGCRLIGRTPEQWRGRTDPEYHRDSSEADAFVAMDRRVMESRQTEIVEEELTTPDGGKKILLTAKTPRLDERGEVVGVIGISRDITRRKRAEEKIQQLNAELERRVEDRTARLEEANRELESFSYSISHDLRAPLRAVNGFSRILLEDYGDRFDDEGRRIATLIATEGQRMGSLIDALLEFSRLGRKAAERVKIDMNFLAREAFAEASADAGDRAIEFGLGDLPPAAGERALLRQVFVNLFSNAVKFTGQRADALVEAGGRIEADGIVYWVRDNGAGFDPRHADKLFGVFQRLHGQEEFAGIGVGLAFAQRIVTRHSGRIWAEGAPGGGATFYFSLPHANGERSEA